MPDVLARSQLLSVKLWARDEMASRYVPNTLFPNMIDGILTFVQIVDTASAVPDVVGVVHDVV